MPNGLTPLHFAAANDQRPAAEYLVSKGADVSAVARHSGTPLDVAYESERREFVRWLESKGGRFTPLRFDVTTLTPAVHRVAFPWGMMNNVLVFSGTDGADDDGRGDVGRHVRARDPDQLRGQHARERIGDRHRQRADVAADHLPELVVFGCQRAGGRRVRPAPRATRVSPMTALPIG
jgi:hypothetical protein